MEVEALRQKGNDHMTAEQFEDALHCYTQGLELMQHNVASQALRFDLHSNRLQALIKLERFTGTGHTEALRYVLDHMYGYDPGPHKMAKIMYRCAIIFDHRRDGDRALYCIHQSSLYSPNNDEVNTFKKNIEGKHLQNLSDNGFITIVDANDVERFPTDCATCLSAFTGSCVQYPCKHVFHEHCFLGWVKKGHPDCPLCRISFIRGIADGGPVGRVQYDT